MRRTVSLVATLAVLAACSGEPTANETDLAALRSACMNPSRTAR